MTNGKECNEGRKSKQRTFKVVKGKKMPRRRTTNNKYPFIDMEVGDCFKVRKEVGICINVKANGVRTAGRMWSCRNNKRFKISVRKHSSEKYITVWRIR